MKKAVPQKEYSNKTMDTAIDDCTLPSSRRFLVRHIQAGILA